MSIVTQKILERIFILSVIILWAGLLITLYDCFFLNKNFYNNPVPVSKIEWAGYLLCWAGIWLYLITIAATIIKQLTNNNK